VSDASNYKWKAKFGGLDVSEAKRLKTLDDENTRPGRRHAEQCDAGRCDAELLNETLFTSLAQARIALRSWRADYIDARPHSQLGWKTPSEFAFTRHPRRDLALRCAEASTPAPRRYHRPTGHIQLPGQNQDWIKLGARSLYCMDGSCRQSCRVHPTIRQTGYFTRQLVAVLQQRSGSSQLSQAGQRR
jgi:hypothetical protein